MSLLQSKSRTGRVMRGIRRAFITEPDRAWTTSELRAWTHARAIYRGKNSGRARAYQCWDIRRAADQLGLVRVGRSSTGSGRAILWRLPDSD
jgi:hypothetical protein